MFNGQLIVNGGHPDPRSVPAPLYAIKRLPPPPSNKKSTKKHTIYTYIPKKSRIFVA